MSPPRSWAALRGSRQRHVWFFYFQSKGSGREASPGWGCLLQRWAPHRAGASHSLGGLSARAGKAGPETRFRESRGPGSHRVAGPAIRPQGCQCHFLPSTLEKQTSLIVYMQLWGAEGEKLRALLVKKNIFQHCCHYFSPNYRACVGSPWAAIQGYNFSMRLRYPRPRPRLGDFGILLPPPPVCPFWPSRLGDPGHGVPQLLFLFEEGHLRERGRDGRKGSLWLSLPDPKPEK